MIIGQLAAQAFGVGHDSQKAFPEENGCLRLKFPGGGPAMHQPYWFLSLLFSGRKWCICLRLIKNELGERTVLLEKWRPMKKLSRPCCFQIPSAWSFQSAGKKMLRRPEAEHARMLAGTPCVFGDFWLQGRLESWSYKMACWPSVRQSDYPVSPPRPLWLLHLHTRCPGQGEV